MVYMPHWPKYFGKKDISLGLSRIETILTALGNPEQKIAPVIHIAGTNGKGSSLAFIRSIFEQSGYKVHAYSSPHLIDFNERIYLAGTNISNDMLFEVIEECRIACEKLQIIPSFFEATTAAAFLAFSRVKADIVILEVGLGGKLDATNVIKSPIMSIITSISLDHTEFLGDTLAKIAVEKAGIIKENCPCIISKQTDEVADLLNKIAFLKKAPSYSYDYDWSVTQDIEDKLIYLSDEEAIEFNPPSLVGDHQYNNAGNAICTALNLRNAFKNINISSINQGISKAFWPGRLQKIYYNSCKTAENIEIWFDGAHNQDGARVVAQWLAKQSPATNYLIIGITKGRDVRSFLQNFSPDLILKIFTVTVENEPSSYNAEFIAQTAGEMGFVASPYASIDEVFYNINIEASQTKKIRVVACGSLFLAGHFIDRN